MTEDCRSKGVRCSERVTDIYSTSWAIYCRRILDLVESPSRA